MDVVWSPRFPYTEYRDEEIWNASIGTATSSIRSWRGKSGRGLAVTLIPGDGVGPEVTIAAVAVIAATGVKIKWESAGRWRQCVPALW